MTPFEQAVCDPNNHRGFTKEALEAHGLPWPPPHGWRKALKARILARMEGASPTRISVIDAMILGQMGQCG